MRWEDGIKVDLLNAAWGSRICLVEVTDQSWSKDIPFISPRIFLIPKSFPLHQVLQFASIKSTVQDPFDFIVLFIVNNFWKRRWLIVTIEGVLGSRDEFNH